MKNSIPRISSVRLHSGGATLKIFRNPRAFECISAFKEDASDVVRFRKDDMAGYAIVAWGFDGGISTSLQIRDSRHVGVGTVAEFVKTQLTDHISQTPRTPK